MNMTSEQKAYISELAAQLVASHGEKAIEMLQTDAVAAITEAHNTRREFVSEILVQGSDRSKMAVKVLCAVVYGRAVARSAAETAIEHCSHIADHSWRRSIGMS